LHSLFFTYTGTIHKILKTLVEFEQALLSLNLMRSGGTKHL